MADDVAGGSGNQGGSTPNSRRRWRIGPLTISDIVSAAALFLALGSILWQVIINVRGSDVRVHPSEFVTVFAHRLFQDIPVVRIGLQLIYENNARPEFSSVVRSGFVRFSLGEKNYAQQWQTQAAIKDAASRPECKSIANADIGRSVR